MRRLRRFPLLRIRFPRECDLVTDGDGHTLGPLRYYLGPSPIPARLGEWLAFKEEN